VASAKQQQVGFNSATNVMIQFLQNIAAVWAKKRHYFCQFFRRKYF
jgi:hypothetical protein